MPKSRLLLSLSLAMLAALAGPLNPAHATSAPVAAYGFEDSAPSTVGDSSVFGNAGTVQGGATRTAGRFGSSLSFDGVDDRVRIADAGSINLATGMTLEAWVKPTSTSGWHTVLMKERITDLSYALYGSGSDYPGSFVATDGETGNARSPGPLTANTWAHLAATYDGTTLRTYVDGELAGSTTQSSGPIIPGDGALWIGGNGIWGEHFKGAIDEVRIYDRALSAAAIQADMTTPVGAPASSAPGLPPSEGGTWTAPQNWPLVAVHASMLSDGKVVAWDAFDAAPQSEHVWDPVSGTFQPMPSGINLFCAGHALLPDGRLFVAGGHELAYVGLRDTRLLNPLTGSWTAGPDMARGRWYPTTTTLPDGRVLIVSGDGIRPGPNDPFFVRPSDTIPEVYDPKTNTMASIPSAGRLMPLYPFMFVAPDGRVVDAGPDTTTRLLNVQTGQWSTLASQSPITGGSAVMYRPGKILKTGAWTDTDFGNPPIGNGAAVLDLDQGVPAWRTTTPTKWARTYHTLTVLPDGDVLSLGGQARFNANSLADSPVLQPEIWDPDSDTWTAMASSVRPRGYHNTSLLLPDGRILLAGSGRLDGSLMANETTAEIFSPPYLNQGPRPTITSAPSTTSYGQTFEIGTPDVDRIAKVSLVRIGSVTHNFNMDQRWQQLSFRKVGSKLEIDAPTSANTAPPGIYYVFILDANGVPSKAAIVSIPANGATGPDTTAPTSPGAVSATGGTDRVMVNWSASTDDVGVTRYLVHRSATAGFTPTAATRVATVTTGTSYADTGLAPGTYYYRVVAEDQAGNASAPSAQASGGPLVDATAPTVALTAPASGAVLRGAAAVTATASDNAGVTGVQFRLDGANLSSEDTTAPYSVNWDTTTATAGAHALSAIARDAAGNTKTAATVAVTVDNSAPTGPQPVAAYSFDEGAGTTVGDATGKGHTGTIREAVWTAAGRNGKALTFDGVNDWVSVDDATDLRLTNAMTIEAWVNPTKVDGWRTAIIKERSGDLAYSLYTSGQNRPSIHLVNGSATAGSALALNAWTHLAATYDATTIRLYVNGVQVATQARANALSGSAGALRIGGNSVWGEWFAGKVDDVRVYDKALTAAQIQTDMAMPVGTPAAPDTTPPSAPGSLATANGLGRVTLTWSAATDDVGVARYQVHRSASTGFTPSAANRIATVTSGTTYADTGLAAGTYRYRVIAEDQAGNVGAPSAETAGSALADTTAPTISLTAPTPATTVRGAATVSATAADDVGVAGVQFRLDGAALGVEDTTAPYSVVWDSTTAAAGAHTLTAVARDAAGNVTTAAGVPVTVDNSAPPGPTPVAAYSFEDGAGTIVTDVTGKGHTGTIREASWNTSGRNGKSLTFDGVNDWVTVADATDLRLVGAMTVEAWVKPAKVDGWRTALIKERSGDLAYALYSSGQNAPSFYGTSGSATAPSAPALNAWTHLAATYDATTIRLYVNGAQVASAARTNALVASAGALRLGGNNIWGEWFAGALDDVRVYDKTLTPAQIAADMSTPVG
jgi:hypothetical protein